MSVKDWAVLTGITIVIVLGWVRLPWHWRSASEESEAMAFGWLPFGDEIKRGLQRGIPTNTVGMTVILVGILALIIDVQVVHSGHPDGRINALDAVIIAWIGLAIVVDFVLLLSIIWFNRPKFAVAPHYRIDKGAIRAWRDAKIKKAVS